MDDLCAINDGGEFRSSIFDIYPNELELKVEDQGHHATFFILGTTIKEGAFVCNLFDKRDSFIFSINRMSLIESNLPQKMFYSAIKGKFLRIAGT